MSNKSEFNVGDEVTVSIPMVLNLGSGKQTYSPNHISGKIISKYFRQRSGWEYEVKWNYATATLHNAFSLKKIENK